MLYLYSDNNKKKTENMISNSITERTVNIIIANPSIDPLEALSQAINEENKLLRELIENRNERTVNALDDLCKKVYEFHNSKL